MMTAYRRPWFPSLMVLFLLACSSGSSSSGCGSGSASQMCAIETTATTCPGKITLECDDGALPDEKSKCVRALKQGTQTIYCCVDEAERAAEGGGGGGGGGGR